MLDDMFWWSNTPIVIATHTREKWALVLLTIWTGEDDSKENSCLGDFLRFELINDLIKKSNWLYEAYTVRHGIIPLPLIWFYKGNTI